MLLSAAALAMFGLLGCSSGTTGGPGADKQEKSKLEKLGDAVRQPEGTFSLSLPLFSTKLKQGESKEVVIGIKRGKNFDEDVVLAFENLPKGVTIEPATPTIKHGDKNAKVTVKAKEDAATDDFTVKVQGKPSKGKESTADLKISISKK
jgi:hypothetical protein